MLKPLKSTGSVTIKDKQGEKYWPTMKDLTDDPDRYEIKTKTIQHVKNVVKLGEPV